jgi:hypothetical protein
MDDDAPAPELFVARDRARRFARYIRDALQERRLHYRGAEVGMESLTQEADEALSAVLADIGQTVRDLLAHRLRDRERGYMEMPLVTAAEAIADRVDGARRLDRAQARGGGGAREIRAAVLGLLDAALLRLEAYVGGYDGKRPLGPSRSTDVAHLLAGVEADHAWRAASAAVGELPPAFDRPPAPIRSDPAGLDDVLRAARAAVPGAAGPWRVEPAGPGQPLRLSLGTSSGGAQAVDPPGRLARAVEVLAFLHPVAVRCAGVPAAPGAGLLSPEAEGADDLVEALTIELADEAAGTLALSVAAAAGGEAQLDADAEAAVRALMQSPPLPDAGPPPPQRLVALMGLLRSLDRALERTVVARAATNACRVAASRLPRESTRKAPIRRRLVAELERRFADLPAHRLEPVAQDVAGGRVASRLANAADAAVLLALFARAQGGRPALDLAPLDAAAIDALIDDLGAIAAVRRDLERGGSVEAARITRLEQASIATLGRLGRLGHG